MAILALIAVALGAFGAHGLKAMLGPDRLEIFQTGVRYQFYHAFALLFLGVWTKDAPDNRMFKLGWLGFFGRCNPFFRFAIHFVGKIFAYVVCRLVGTNHTAWWYSLYSWMGMFDFWLERREERSGMREEEGKARGGLAHFVL